MRAVLERVSHHRRVMVVIAAAALGLWVAQAEGVTLPSGCTQAGTTVTCTYTSGSTTFTVPGGVTLVHVVAVGGEGAASSGGAAGGYGAVVSGDLTVTPTSTLTAVVAGNGSGGTGGANGGGAGTTSSYEGTAISGGGGGASDVRATSDEPASRLLVAAGGGGGGNLGDTAEGEPTVAGGAGGAGAAMGGNGTAFAADGGTAEPGHGGSAATGSSGGPGGTGGTSASPYTFAGCAGAAGTTNGGTGSIVTGGCASGGGGGGGGGLAGGGAGGSGGVGNTTPDMYGQFAVTAGYGGGGGGSNLVPTGGSTATDTSGTPSVAISYTVPGGAPAAPAAAIAVPANGASFAAGQAVTTSFVCTEGSGGPGITSCVDQSGRPSGSTLDTATPGSHTLTVTATSGDGQATMATSSYTVTPATGSPVNTGLPTITGTPKAGSPLACSNGNWSNSPTSYAYGWSRDGTPIQGASTGSYTVQKPDEQLTLTCTVTASNAAGAGTPATSRGVFVPVPKVPRCPAATGRLAGQTLGLVHLGMTRSQARRAYTHSSNRGKKFEDFFCLTPIGVRVGYASSTLIKTLPGRLGKRVSRRVIWASTSSGYYSVHSIRPGATVAAAGQQLKLAGPFHVGLNYWYLAPNGSSTAVLKVRRGLVEEIGIGDKSLTTGHQAEINFLKSFS